ncbi:MAG TPA: hypothetical protein VNG29_02295 [Candidatus Paceibacterota bacterium]|nr:hypothetical protein [Candidatus Paceibacterota bacterium]
MKNVAEALEHGPEEQPEKKEGARSAEIVDIRTRKALTPEEIEARKSHPSWPVTIGEKGEVIGLPEGVSQKDVITFLDKDGHWLAQYPSKALIDEKKEWRSDWMDIRKP